MSVIPSYYTTDAEHYITVSSILSFFEKVSIKPSSKIKSDLFSELEAFAEKTEENREKVLTWLDATLKEGITELHLFMVSFDMADIQLLSSENYITSLQRKLDNEHGHFVPQKVSKDFRIIQCTSSTGNLGRVISFLLCKTVFVVSTKQPAYTLLYPAFVDIYVDKSIVVVRGKSKSTMYEILEDSDSSFSPNINSAINTDRILFQAYDAVKKFTQLGLNRGKDYTQFRRNLYQLLKKYTDTPAEITKLIDEQRTSMNQIAHTIQREICKLGDNYSKDIAWDIENLVEKYFSISYKDKSIFTRNRDAYPLSLIAKDDEESKVEQTAAFEDPLQSKAIFFDNKRMMQKTRCCEGITFKYKPSEQRKFFRNPFKVLFLAKNSFFVVKFTEYTVEEDIQNVLFSLFNSDSELS